MCTLQWQKLSATFCFSWWLLPGWWECAHCCLRKWKRGGWKRKRNTFLAWETLLWHAGVNFLPYGRAVGMVKPLLVRERLPSPMRKSNLRSWVKKSIRYLRLQAERPKREQNTAVRLGEKWWERDAGSQEKIRSFRGEWWDARNGVGRRSSSGEGWDLSLPKTTQVMVPKAVTTGEISTPVVLRGPQVFLLTQ